MVKGHAFRKQWKESRKQLNKRASSRVKSLNKPTYEERIKAKRALDDVKAKAAQLLEARKEVRKAKANKRSEKKKKKKKKTMPCR
mmetsp:Transcript_7637/g.5999  ORF Transcript_7637/g.5999 Transcript_7637/m.5999 type:complete len:85 (-) Transcript_7637:33-287(-)